MSQQDLRTPPVQNTEPQRCGRGPRLMRVLVVLVILAGLAYLVIWPTAHMIYQWLTPPVTGRVLHDASLAESIQIRVMEALATAGFAIVGASLGSFLNVSSSKSGKVA